MAHLGMGWWHSRMGRKRVSPGNESPSSLSDSDIYMLCGPGTVASLLWASVLSSVEWETESGEGEPLALDYLARQ